MIPRYALPEMTAIWTDEHRFRRMLDVEIALARAQADLGVIPREAAERIARDARFDAARIDEIERRTRHDVIAFVTNVAESLGDAARFLHFGMTSSDVLDTALALQIREAGSLLLGALQDLRRVFGERARAHADTPMIGRTHGMFALPTTLGAKLALFHDECGRHVARLQTALDEGAVGKLSGAVGTFAHGDPRIEEAVCERLGLRPENVSNQVVQRDRIAHLVGVLALIGATLEKWATEVRHLQRSEVGEITEPFARGEQKGSSAMPHKQNPISAERICGLARLLRGYAQTALENVPLWHERDISHSSAERILLPDTFGLLFFMLREAHRIADGFEVHPTRMRENLARSGGAWASQAVLVCLTGAGMAREEAYERLQAHALAAQEGVPDFQTRVQTDAELTARAGGDALARCFSLEHHLRHIPAILRRAGILPV
ncbi:MAG: adenylosuccinate lyase [Planctomycetes bacterium]|nr:adenylosuccinate lyase [Planctomycetota bacterium]